ncbi:MAG TPA: hypothetical protein VGJ20_20365 [Xanthobacteraceae bacterium]
MAKATKTEQQALARALKQERDRLVYLSRKGGWFWTEVDGNRVTYTGPFKDDRLALRSLRKWEAAKHAMSNATAEPPQA